MPCVEEVARQVRASPYDPRSLPKAVGRLGKTSAAAYVVRTGARILAPGAPLLRAGRAAARAQQALLQPLEIRSEGGVLSAMITAARALCNSANSHFPASSVRMSRRCFAQALRSPEQTLLRARARPAGPSCRSRLVASACSPSAMCGPARLNASRRPWERAPPSWRRSTARLSQSRSASDDTPSYQDKVRWSTVATPLLATT
jgi:hypothetical protein